jgi:hypothetical protein
MLPAPASIAAAPSPRSSVSCNPAVPPPPVTGAALGIGLVDELARAVAVLVTVAVGVGVPDAGELELTPGVLDALLLDAVLLLDALLLDVLRADRDEFPEEADAVTVPVGEVVTEGEKTVGVEVEPEVHADTPAEASRVRAAQQTAVSLAPRGVSAIVLRTFMDPPHAPGR